MTPETLRKVFFMLFEEGLLDDIQRFYYNYKYMINDISLEIIFLISKIYLSNDKKEILSTLDEISNKPLTKEFPDIKSLVYFIGNNLVNEKILTLPDIKKYPKSNGIHYKSPGNFVISINGTKKDNLMEIINLLHENIADKVIFRENIDNHPDKWDRNLLKLIHTINTGDLDYPKDAIEFFLSFTNTPKDENQLKPYTILLNIFEAKARLNQLTDDEYNRLYNILKETKFIFNLIYTKIWKIDKMEVLKEIASAKKDVKADSQEIEEYLKNLIK